MRDPANADDVVQEAIVVMLAPAEATHKPKYKTTDHFWPWAFTILRHKIGNILKARESLPLEDTVVDIIPSGDDAGRRTWEEAVDEELQHLLSKMRRKDRETIHALIMKSEGFMLPNHLASLPRTTWEPRVSRARKKLRGLMKKEGWL